MILPIAPQPMKFLLRLLQAVWNKSWISLGKQPSTQQLATISICFMAQRFHLPRNSVHLMLSTQKIHMPSISNPIDSTPPKIKGAV